MSAHSRFLTKFIAIAALMSASGCICVTGPSGQRGDITFTWTFEGRTCMQSQEIAQVVIQIPGQTLQNNGVYGCVNGGTAGIKLLDFRPGTYNYTISAQNTAGTVIFSATGRVTVNGSVAEIVDLKRTGSATGSAYVAWTLPTGTNVTCQYLASIDITIDGAAQPMTNACATGLYNPSVTTLQGVGFALPPGQHTILIDARDQAGLYYYRKAGTFTVNAAETTQQVFTLDWLVGTMALRWTFSNGLTQLNCAQAGVTEMSVTLRDANGDLTQTVPCSFAGLDGYVPYVYSGTFQVFTAAYGTAGALYRSLSTSPLQVTAQAGVFPQLTTQAPQILMSL